MNKTPDLPPLELLLFPYAGLETPTGGEEQIRRRGKSPGSALVWHLDRGFRPDDQRVVESRPGGMALVVLLPRAVDLANDPRIWELVARSRPQAILPHHDRPHVEDLVQVLRKPPEDIPAAVTDYLRWRGFRLDGDTTHLVRRTLELSAELTSVTALSRSIYLSRRALGRRFASRGLPVPSHWLQFGRVLRFALRLQNTPRSVHSVAVQHSYPDGFAASNQIHRLIGYRPSDVRERLGWEWILEAWLRREADAGCLRPIDSMPADGRSTGADQQVRALRRQRTRAAG